VTSCLLADDHPAVVQALAQVLAEEGFAVTTAHRGDEALVKLVETRPDVAVIDAAMPGLTGLELARRVHSDRLPTALLFYAGAADRALLRAATDAGVRGFVLKDAPLHELIGAIHSVAAGGTYLDGALAGVLSQDVAERPLPQLTKRECEVLTELAEGGSYEEIAGLLSISTATVRGHVHLAMHRLNANTDTQAVAAALSLSLIG
jgi:two-component system response regulator DesR